MTGKEIVTLMRKHKWTIKALGQRWGITQKRIREVRKNGVTGRVDIAHWKEYITGIKDPWYFVLNCARALASGTIAGLIGRNDYQTIEQAQGEFVAFIEAANQYCSWETWQDTWCDFVKAFPCWDKNSPAPVAKAETMPTAARVTAAPKLPAIRRDTFARDGADDAALVAKYRPRCLAEVLGQPDVVEALREFVDRPHPAAFLFAGESGTGKTSAAYALAYELGVGVDDAELGGLLEIPSGSQSAESVRRILERVGYRPLVGSGWRVLIVNECDRMGLPVETIWLDALEHLPPQTVVIFTTNDASRLSRRFRDRCETFMFRSGTEQLGPWVQALAQRVWEQEGGEGECPGLERLGMPTLEDLDSMHCSFRLALQQLQRRVRALKNP